MAEPMVLNSRRPETLVDVLDRLLDTGAVLDGHLVISVAGVDLIFVGLRALLASVDSASRLMSGTPRVATAAAHTPMAATP